MTDWVIEAQQLYKSFGATRAVDGVTVRVPRGAVFALLGPNGAGKTTTLRLLMGMYIPDAGEIRVLDGPPGAARRRLGYLPEARGLYRQARVAELLVYLARLKGLDARTAARRVQAWLERFGLAEWAQRKVHELSHGMQQKVQLAATLVHDPELVILDEPFQGLDPVNVRLVDEIIRELQAQGRTVLLSSHQLHRVERLADQVALIHRGRIVEHGPLTALRRRYMQGRIAVRLAPGSRLPADLPGVVTVQPAGEPQSWYLQLAPQASPQQVLFALVQAAVPLEGFEVVQPSLEDIFLQAVAGQEPAPAAA